MNNINSIANTKNIIFPEWLSIVSAVHKDIINSSICNQTLYHYTSIGGFMSIMQNRDFWVSNINYMNDSQEFENGKRLFKDFLQEKLQHSDIQRCYLQSLLEICGDQSSRGFHKINEKDIFAMSFCGDGDILTQWQFYGNKGISIGFDNAPSDPFDAITFMNEDQYNEEVSQIAPEEMNPHDEIRLFPSKIIYDDNEKKRIFERIFDIGMDFINQYGNEVVDMCVDGISDALFYYFALMKDKNFVHENESRFLYYTHDYNRRVHFRKRGEIILPYIQLKVLDVNCRPHKIFPIKEIVIAPSSQKEYIADSVKYFLEKVGYDYLVEKVRTSQIPYRE